MAALGGVAFYLVFPNDLLEDFVYPRRPPSIWYQIAAIISAAVFMTAVYVVARPANRRPRVAAGFGALLGVLASAPAQLALAAVVRSNPWRNVAIICWTTASWCVAGAAISWMLTRTAPAQ
jgi:ABC-type Fe3+-siderophore transport system permease subunit